VELCGIVAHWVCDVSTETFSRTEGSQACVPVCLGVSVFASCVCVGGGGGGGGGWGGGGGGGGGAVTHILPVRGWRV